MHDGSQMANDVRLPARLLVGSSASVITQLSGRTGRILWQRRLRGLLGGVACDATASYMIAGDHLRPVWRRDPGAARDHAEFPFTPTLLEARRTRDGALLWRRNDWQLAGPGMLALDGATLLAMGSDYIGDQRLYALDPRTGDTRWTYAGIERERSVSAEPASHELAYERVMQVLVGVWNARAYLTLYRTRRENQQTTAQRWLCSVDTATGAEVWRRPVEASSSTAIGMAQVSPRGALLCLVQHTNPDVADKLALFIPLNATPDGSETASLALGTEERLCGLADDGVVYLATPQPRATAPPAPRPSYPARAFPAPPEYLLRAVHISDGAVQWEIVHGPSPVACAVTDARIFTAGRFQRDVQNWDTGVAEISAFDRRTGARLWRWRSPRTIGGMIRLWNGRIAEVVAAAAVEAARQISDRLARRDLASLWYWLIRELRYGQWLHPQRIDGNIVLHADAAQNTLYVGARIGVVALDMANGQVRWYAPPTEVMQLAHPRR